MIVKQYGVDLSEKERIPEMVAEKSFIVPSNTICGADEVARFCRDTLRLDRCAEEYVYLFCLNIKGHILAISQVSHGGLNAALLSSREVYIRALLCGAASIILAHNHPSGAVDASLADDMITEKIYDAGQLINIQLLDSLIIGRHGQYYSYREAGKIILQ